MLGMHIFSVATVMFTNACLGKRLLSSYIEQASNRLDATEKELMEAKLDLSNLESQLDSALSLKAKLHEFPSDSNLQKQLDDVLGEVDFVNDDEKSSLLGLSGPFQREEKIVDQKATQRQSPYELLRPPLLRPLDTGKDDELQQSSKDDESHRTNNDDHHVRRNDTLGSIAKPGSSIRVAEAQPFKSFEKALARFLTDRHDFALEDFDTGTPKYVIKGVGLSTHQRMFLVVPGEKEPRFAIYLTYSRLNPIGMLFGQYVYRVLPYHDAKNIYQYSVKKTLLTITRDRLGRGGFWARAEWRVYTGDGGCRLMGLLSCDSSKQVYYALSQGIGDLWLNHDLEMFEGPIRAMSGDAQTAKLYDGSTWGRQELDAHMVAETEQLSGSNRLLNWGLSAVAGGLRPCTGRWGLTAVACALPGFIWRTAQKAWLDTYQLTYKKPVDEALFGIIMALQSISIGHHAKIMQIATASASRGR